MRATGRPLPARKRGAGHPAGGLRTGMERNETFSHREKISCRSKGDPSLVFPIEDRTEAKAQRSEDVAGRPRRRGQDLAGSLSDTQQAVQSGGTADGRHQHRRLGHPGKEGRKRQVRAGQRPCLGLRRPGDHACHAPVLPDAPQPLSARDRRARWRKGEQHPLLAENHPELRGRIARAGWWSTSATSISTN